jgi:predicted Ser/Thr protein kinase
MNGSEPNANMPAKCPQCGAALPSGALDGLCPACLLQQGATAETALPDSVPFQPPSVEEVARLFPQLEILGFIGKGGMGAVYQARQPALDRLVALKILPPQIAGGSTFAERFNREARALAKLNHPNIVTLYEFGQAGTLPFFIMEFVDGLTLRQLERAGTLSPREALKIVPQICEALQFAHDEGIVHRDIKPENILLDKKGRVKIADFGIAKLIGRSDADVSVTETNQAIGTPHYMAPEQLAQPQAVDHRADIYSLGVVFYEMLTGELPLGKFGPPSSRVPGVHVDVRLDEVVLRALEQKPELRFQQASDVKTVVETIASGSGSGSGSGASAAATAPPPPDPAALTREILARDYTLSIGSCFSRGWALLLTDFWPFIGVTALLMLLNNAAMSSGVGLIVCGPLMGGLTMYYLKKLRGQPATLETAFCGFSTSFLALFLGGLISGILTFIGYLFLILPGIYLHVVWMFSLSLTIDKRLEFWPAMELSRRAVNKHWWKLFGFWLLCVLLYLIGVALFGVGYFFTAPIAFAASAYAYEDIFGRTSAPAGPAVTPAAGSPQGGGAWKVVVAVIAAGAFLLLLVVLAIALFIGLYFPHRVIVHQRAAVAQEEALKARAVAQARASITTEPELPAHPSEAARLKLAAAEADLAAAQRRLVTGSISDVEFKHFQFARDLAQAEFDQKPAEIARIRLATAEHDLAVAQKLFNSGQISDDELRKAKLARDLAEAIVSRLTHQ